ncbi:MAG: hypothetical protein ACYCQI_08000 [Gammaproteobacteria bacterium]
MSKSRKKDKHYDDLTAYARLPDDHLAKKEKKEGFFAKFRKSKTKTSEPLDISKNKLEEKRRKELDKEVKRQKEMTKKIEQEEKKALKKTAKDLTDSIKDLRRFFKDENEFQRNIEKYKWLVSDRNNLSSAGTENMFDHYVTNFNYAAGAYVALKDQIDNPGLSEDLERFHKEILTFQRTCKLKSIQPRITFLVALSTKLREELSPAKTYRPPV